MSNININVVQKLELTRVKKYWKHAGQVETELD